MATFRESQHPRNAQGAFEVKAASEPDLTLTPDAPALTFGPETCADDDDSFQPDWRSDGTGNESFNTAVRALLGVSDQRRKVTAVMDGGDVGTDATPESWECITVSCAGRSTWFADLPSLLRALELAQSPPVTLERLEAMIGQDAVIRFPGGVTWKARVANAKGALVLLIGAERGHHLCGGNWHHNGRGQWELRIDPAQLLSVDVPDPSSAATLARREHDEFIARPNVGGVPFDEMPAAEQQHLVGLYVDRLARLTAILSAAQQNPRAPHIYQP
jgi:hypothetical protein